MASAIRHYARVLWRRKLIVVACMVAAVAGSLVYDVTKTPDYTTAAQLRLTPQISSAVLQANNSSLLSAANPVDVPTALEVIQSPAVQQAAAAMVPGIPVVSAAQVRTTDVVELTVTSTDPVVAAKAANVVCGGFHLSAAPPGSRRARVRSQVGADPDQHPGG